MIKLTGTIRNNGVTEVLFIHSKNLADKIIRLDKMIKVEEFKDGLLLRPIKESRATVVKNKRIQIAVKKLIKNKIIDQSKINKKHIIIYLDPTEWSLTEVLQKSRGSPITKELPKNIITKKAAIAKKQNKYYIDLSIKKLNELAKKKSIRCLLNRKQKIILIRSIEPQARKLTPHSKGRIQIAIPKEILKKEEIKELFKKTWLPTKINFNLKSFGLTLEDFYSVKEENEIVKYLIKNNVKVGIKNPSDPFDIYLPKIKSCIEIHNSQPYKEDLVTRHKIKAGQVRLRILEANFFTKRNKLNNFFLVINREWEKGKYISELTRNIDKKVHIIYTDFKDKWYEKIGKNLIKTIDIN